MIVSNMELTIMLWGYFFSSVEAESNFYTFAYGAGVAFLLVYPLCIALFLLKNQGRLLDKNFKIKFDALYDFINTDSKEALLYNPIFCIRRFYIVLINIVFNVECPWTDYSQNHYKNKIFCFLLLQSIYVFYIADSRPHLHTTFNRLEFLNEGTLMILAYMMIAFSGCVLGQVNRNIVAEVVGILMIATVIISNLYVLTRKTIVKFKEWLRRRKEKKERMARVRAKLKALNKVKLAGKFGKLNKLKMKPPSPMIKKELIPIEEEPDTERPLVPLIKELSPEKPPSR